MGILSVNLAVLNVLPFPPLDGGRIAVVLIEAVRRRKLPAEREAMIYLTGFMVLIALVILISIQDVQRTSSRASSVDPSPALGGGERVGLLYFGSVSRAFASRIDTD